MMHMLLEIDTMLLGSGKWDAGRVKNEEIILLRAAGTPRVFKIVVLAKYV